MKSKKLKLTNFSNQSLNEKLMHNIYAGSIYCGNTCDCSCTCDTGNTQQLNSNVNSTSTNNRETSFVSEVVELGIAISWLNQ